MLTTADAAAAPASAALDFLWLELTNQCNLQCTHCYADSGPYAGADDKLDTAHYLRLIREAAGMGCRRIQFIGGEPTLHRGLPGFIRLATESGYTYIEVFSNLTRLSNELLECFVTHRVHVATSVYGPTAAVHDAVTRNPGSFTRTIGNLRRLLDIGVPVRASVIEMDENAGQAPATLEFLRELGVSDVGVDRLRKFGRGAADEQCGLGELCGGCAENTLCVGADGKVSPCIMSKRWSVGSVLESDLPQLALSQRLAELRQDIYRAVIEPHGGAGPGQHAICMPKICNPYDHCAPKQGPGPCEPNGCNPCRPKG